ncbi:MAG: hypothetical protein ACRYG8_44180 [Janthinobacterium lividum]
MLKRLLTSLGRWLRDPEAGDKVVLIKAVELFDHGLVIAPGATGVVTMTSWEADPTEPVGEVCLDRRLSALDASGNRLQVWPRASQQGPTTWSHFKKVTPFD